jgi:hypothetical protein
MEFRLTNADVRMFHCSWRRKDMATTPSQAELDGYLETLLKHRMERFSEWEDGFLRSLKMQRARGVPYSEKQAAKLDGIADRLLR